MAVVLLPAPLPLSLRYAVVQLRNSIVPFVIAAAVWISLNARLRSSGRSTLTVLAHKRINETGEIDG